MIVIITWISGNTEAWLPTTMAEQWELLQLIADNNDDIESIAIHPLRQSTNKAIISSLAYWVSKEESNDL